MFLHMDKTIISHKIIFTGGGTAGHVTPNLALLERCQRAGWEVFYIGSRTGIERQLIASYQIKYYAIFTGKLRRYFSWRNFFDPLKIFVGICQAFFLCRKLKPQVIFSKGGFVAFPVVVGAWLNRIPVISHESDVTPGLANRLIYPFTAKFCVNFAVTQKYFKSAQKIIVTGTPLRESLFHGNADQGRKICAFTSAKKIILVFGGSLGAEKINQVVRELLPNILTEFQIVHVCGAGKIAANCNYVGYKQFAYLNEDFGHVLAAADLVIARAGANTVYELLALHKPNILIPLAGGSRGDQIVNAQYASSQGLSQMLPENELTADILWQKINWLNEHHPAVMEQLVKFQPLDSVSIIFELLEKYI